MHFVVLNVMSIRNEINFPHPINRDIWSILLVY